MHKTLIIMGGMMAIIIMMISMRGMVTMMMG